MGLFDWTNGFFGRAAKSKGKEREPPRARREFSVVELERELGLAKKRGLDVSEEAQAILDGISSQLGELNRLVKVFGASATDPESAHAAARESMRKKFVERMLRLNPPEVPPEPEYGALAEYHSRLLEFLGKATKNVSDNRYFFNFLGEDAKAFASVMRALCGRAGELESALKEKAGTASAYAELEGMLEAIGGKRKAHANFGELLRGETAALRELEGEAGSEKSLLEAGPEDSLAAGLEDLGSTEARLLARQSELQSKAAEAFGPLKRLLRKYAHGAPKNEGKLAQKYAGDDVPKAFFESGDAGELKTLFSRLREFAAREGGDAGQAAPRIPPETALAGMLEEHAQLAGQLAEAGEKRRVLQARKARQDARKEEAKRLRDGIGRLEARMREERAGLESLLAATEEKAGALLRAEVRISRENTGA